MHERTRAHTHTQTQVLLQALLQASRGFGRIWTNLSWSASITECQSNVGVVHPTLPHEGPFLYM